MDTDIIHIRVPHSVKAELAKKAESERRTLSNYVAKLIADHLDDPPKPPTKKRS